MPPCPLKPDAWKAALKKYPNKEFAEAIFGMLTYGALIGNTDKRSGIRVYQNHGSASAQPEVLTKDLAEQLRNHRLTVYNNFKLLPKNFVSSPLGLTDKKDGTKRRIHDLSHPADISINGGIHPSRSSVKFATLRDIQALVKECGGEGCNFIKRDFKDAYRHIPVSPFDSPLLGFQWKDKFYEERFLPFGLSSAPFLFNLVAEAFHWILEQRLKDLKAKVIHYLDDFLIVVPKGSDHRQAMKIFADTSAELGFIIKTSKNREGFVTDFVGYELDSKKMQARLPVEKKVKTGTIASAWARKEKISLQELENLIGSLEHASHVIPGARAHMRRLLDLKETFPSGSKPHARIAISPEAKEDLEWWIVVMGTNPHVALVQSTRKTILVWTDGRGFKGMGGYYLKPGQKFPTLTAPQAFAIPHAERDRREKDQVLQDMIAVESAIKQWGEEFKGFKVVFQVRTAGTVAGLQNKMLREKGPMEHLRRILTMAGKLDIEVYSKWVQEGQMDLASALSRFDKSRVGSLAPQLLSVLK